MKTVQWAIRGRVQGVGFRYFVREQAERLRLSGTVKNEPDGSVTVVVQGTVQDIDRLKAVIQKGNGYSHVDWLTETEISADFSLHSFSIIR